MDSDAEMALIFLLLLRRRRRRRLRQRKRSYWMRPLTSSRLTEGHFSTLMQELRADRTKFVQHFGMCQASFDHLLALLTPQIQRADTAMRRSIPAEQRLAITLRYLASGSSFSELHHAFRCGTSTVTGIVNDVCDQISRHLHDLCFPKLLPSEWLTIADGFQSRANFPNCLGTIFARRLRLKKEYFAMDLMAVCDSNNRIVFVDVGVCGDTAESSVYESSAFIHKLQDNTLNIPPDRPVMVEGEPLPFVFIGDEAFSLSTHMMTPYRSKTLTRNKKAFNYRVGRASRCGETSLAVLTNRWHILHRPLDVKVDSAAAIIRASCCLHNYVTAREGVDFQDTLVVTGLEQGEAVTPAGAPPSGVIVRNKFVEYFTSEAGTIPLQDRVIGP